MAELRLTRESRGVCEVPESMERGAKAPACAASLVFGPKPRQKLVGR